MFLPPATILKSRIHLLHNFAEITSAQLDTVERVSELFADAARANLDHMGQRNEQFKEAGFAPSADKSSEPKREMQIALQFVDEMFKIAGDSHKALIKTTEAQIRIVDEIIFAAIARVSNFSPREIEGGFETINIALKGAEETLHEVSSAAIHTVELSEEEFHQASLMTSEAPSRKTTKGTAAKAKKALALPSLDHEAAALPDNSY